MQQSRNPDDVTGLDDPEVDVSRMIAEVGAEFSKGCDSASANS